MSIIYRPLTVILAEVKSTVRRILSYFYDPYYGRRQDDFYNNFITYYFLVTGGTRALLFIFKPIKSKAGSTDRIPVKIRKMIELNCVGVYNSVLVFMELAAPVKMFRLSGTLE